MPVSVVQLERELRLKLKDDPELKLKGREFAEEVRDTWIAIWEAMGPHPYESGDYADSIEVHGEGKAISFGKFPAGAVSDTGEKIGGRFTGKNVYAHYRVGTTDPKAHFIEYGTGWDGPGTHSPWGPFTDTPEFAPAAHTAAYHHGTGPD